MSKRSKSSVFHAGPCKESRARKSTAATMRSFRAHRRGRSPQRKGPTQIAEALTLCTLTTLISAEGCHFRRVGLVPLRRLKRCKRAVHWCKLLRLFSCATCSACPLVHLALHVLRAPVCFFVFSEWELIHLLKGLPFRDGSMLRQQLNAGRA